MWKGFKRRVSKLAGKEGKPGEKSTRIIADDPFFTMGIQYKSFEPENTQVYGMYQKDDSVPQKEEEDSPNKTIEEPEERIGIKQEIIANMSKDPVGVYVPPVTLLAPREIRPSFKQKGENVNNVAN